MRDFINNHWFFFLFVLALTITSISTPNVSAQSGAISLDHTVGRLGLSDSIACGQPIEFHLRTLNNTGDYVLALQGVFEIYSPDGALWAPIVLDTIPLGWKNLYDFFVYLSVYNDTACFTAWVIFATGIPDGFDSVTWTISTQVNCSEDGKTICIDSVMDGRDGCDWLWAADGGGIPTWDGPHCFKIVSCCNGLRGDLNYDGKSANTLDLSYMVDYIFRGSNKPGDCIESRDINGDGDGPNILDLTFLVDYMFRGGPPPEACP